MREPTSNESSNAVGPPRRRLVRRWARRILIGAPVTALGVIVAALIGLHTDWGREQVRRRAVSALREMFPGGIELRQLEGSVLGTITARGVAIYDGNRRRAIAVERASVDLSLVALLRHTIQLNRLDVEGVTVLAIDDGRGLNLATLVKPRQDPSPSTWRVQLEDVRLARGAIELTRPSESSPSGLASDHFDNLAVQGNAAIDPGGAVIASVTGGLRWRERGFTADLRASAQVVDGVIEVKRADARFGDLNTAIRDLRIVSPSNVTGSVELRAAEGSLRQLVPTLPASPAMTLTATVKPKTADLLRLTVDASIGNATLSGELALAPSGDRPHATGALQLHNLQPAMLLGPTISPELARAQLTHASIAFDAAAARDSVSLDNIVAALHLRAELGYGPTTPVPLTLDARLQNRRLTTSVSGSIGSSQLRGNADVTVGDQLLVHEARLQGHLAAKDVPDELSSAHSLAGVIDMNLSAQGKVDLKALTSPTTHDASSALAATSSLVPPSTNATAHTAAGRLPALTITGVVDGNDLGVAGYAADRLHLALTPVTIAAWPRGNLVATLTGVRVQGQKLPNLELRADSATAGAVDVDVHLTPLRSPRVDSRAPVATATGSASSPASAATSLPGAALRTSGPTPLTNFYEAGTLDLNASIRVDHDYRGADITLRNVRGALRGLEVTANAGQIALRADRQEIRGLRLRSKAGSIAIDGVRTGRNVTAKIAIDQLELAPLAVAAPQLAGLEGRVQLRASATLRGRKLEGSLRGNIAHLVARPGTAPVDADLEASAAPDLIHVAVRAANARVGEIVVGADVAPPIDLFNVAAWQALDRRAVRRLSVHSPRIDLGAMRHVVGAPTMRTGLATTVAATDDRTADSLSPALEGHAAIDLELSPTGGTLRATVANLIVAASPVAMDIALRGDLDADGNANLSANARIATISVNAAATLHVPSRPFAVTAWTLTPERLLRASLEVPRFAITDSVAGSLGLGTWRGEASASFDLERGSDQARGRIALLDVRGGPLQRPVELVVDLTTDADIMHLVGEGKLDGIPAMRLAVELPLPAIASGNTSTLARRWADLPLKGAITFGPVPAAAIARTFGATTTNSRPTTASTTPDAVRTRGRLAGTLGGEMRLAGTLSAPDIQLEVGIADLGTQRAKIRELRLGAKYAAGAIHAELTAANDPSGRLHGLLDFDLNKPADAHLKLAASGFDLSPLARLAPAALLGVTAQLDGALDVRVLDNRRGPPVQKSPTVVTEARPASGSFKDHSTADHAARSWIDPKQMQVAGNLTLSKVRLPLANQVGALTDATIRLALGAGRVTVDLQGNIETGKVTATASAALDGIAPRSGTLDLVLTDLALIAPMTPTVGAKLHVDARLANDRWKLDARLTDGKIRVPAEQGRVLHPASPPTDLVFVANARDTAEPPRRLGQTARSWAANRARSPWLEIALAIESVTLRTDEATGMVRGKTDIAIADSGLSVTGMIRLTGGDVMLFGRRYQIARAALSFDGPLDPAVDAELRHDFSHLTLTAMVTGRTSKPQFHFRSSPADYTEAQLLGFFLGGNPSASGRDAEAANSVAAAVASQTLGAMITRQLPVRLDVLSYQPQTTSSSGAFVAGRWITDKLLLLMRNRTNPRPLENSTEGELQHWLGRGLLLDGVAGDRGTFGLDLLWNRRW